MDNIPLGILSPKMSVCFFFVCFLLSFKLGFTPCQAEQPLQGMALQEKKSTKRLKHTGNLFRKNLQLKDVC